MSRYLVAGGAGFLGSHIVDHLIREGEVVTVLDDLSSGRISNLSDVLGKIAFIKGRAETFRTKEKFDFVLNLASNASRVEWEKNGVRIALANALGSNNLIKIALESHARYLFASTSEVYGNPEIVPTPEEYVGRINPIGSRSSYDEGKRFAEALITAYSREKSLDSVIVRIFNTYGPRMRGGDYYGRVIDRFVQQSLSGNPITVYGNGTQTRSFAYVSDTVNGIITALTKGGSGTVYNIGSSREITIISLANLIINITKVEPRVVFHELPPDDPKRRGADCAKLKALGWNDTVSLDTGIRRTVAYMREEIKPTR